MWDVGVAGSGFICYVTLLALFNCFMALQDIHLSLPRTPSKDGLTPDGVQLQVQWGGLEPHHAPL